MGKRNCCLSVIIPLFSVLGVLGISWLIAAFMEVFTNNLTMIKILGSTITTDKISTDDVINYHGDRDVIRDGEDKVFWFVQVCFSYEKTLSFSIHCIFKVSKKLQGSDKSWKTCKKSILKIREIKGKSRKYLYTCSAMGHWVRNILAFQGSMARGSIYRSSKWWILYELSKVDQITNG